MQKRNIVELPSYHAECNSCMYSKFTEPVFVFTWVYGYVERLIDLPCGETDCKHYGLYKLMKRIK